MNVAKQYIPVSIWDVSSISTHSWRPLRLPLWYQLPSINWIFSWVFKQSSKDHRLWRAAIAVLHLLAIPVVWGRTTNAEENRCNVVAMARGTKIYFMYFLLLVRIIVAHISCIEVHRSIVRGSNIAITERDDWCDARFELGDGIERFGRISQNTCVSARRRVASSDSRIRSSPAITYHHVMSSLAHINKHWMDYNNDDPQQHVSYKNGIRSADPIDIRAVVTSDMHTSIGSSQTQHHRGGMGARQIGFTSILSSIRPHKQR